jgi:hypothetical protein
MSFVLKSYYFYGKEELEPRIVKQADSDPHSIIIGCLLFLGLVLLYGFLSFQTL